MLETGWMTDDHIAFETVHDWLVVTGTMEFLIRLSRNSWD